MRFREWLERTKVQNHPVWVRRWAKDPFSVLPEYLELSPVGACNHRCTFCAPEMLGYKTNYLDAALLAERFAELKALRKADPDDLGVRNFHIAGEGEPMLHPYLGRIYESARSNGISVGMLTNGVPLTEARAYEIFPHLDLYLQVSINAGTMESYAAIHRTDPRDWRRIWKNIETAVRIRREVRSSSLIGVQMTVLIAEALDNGRLVPANWPEVEFLVQRAKESGVDYVTVKPYSQHPYSQATMKLYGNTSYASTLDGIIATGERLRLKYETGDFEVVFRFNRFKEYDETRSYEFCHVTPTLWGYIQSDGVLISCSAHWTNPLFHLGNINHQTFREIWFGETRRRHLEAMKSFDISICRKGCQPDKDNRFLAGYRKS
jgi:cyclic pyranopterin phosphate synthase